MRTSALLGVDAFEPNGHLQIAKDETIRKTLRSFLNAQETRTKAHLESIQVLGSAVLQAIIAQVEGFRNPLAIGMESISETWSMGNSSVTTVLDGFGNQMLMPSKRS